MAVAGARSGMPACRLLSETVALFVDQASLTMRRSLRGLARTPGHMSPAARSGGPCYPHGRGQYWSEVIKCRRVLKWGKRCTCSDNLNCRIGVLAGSWASVLSAWLLRDPAAACRILKYGNSGEAQCPSWRGNALSSMEARHLTHLQDDDVAASGIGMVTQLTDLLRSHCPGVVSPGAAHEGQDLSDLLI
jgi:hypothetical protein